MRRSTASRISAHFWRFCRNSKKRRDPPSVLAERPEHQFGALPVIRRIDVLYPVRGQRHGDGAGKQARNLLREAGRLCPEELACIMPGLFQILRAHGDGLHVHGLKETCFRDSQGALNREREWRHGECEIGLCRLQSFVSIAESICCDERCGRIDAADMLRCPSLRCQPFRGVVDYRERAGLVVRKVSGAQKGCLCPGRARDACDLLIICRYEDMIEKAGFVRRPDGIGDDGLAEKGPDILARNALRAAPRRYHRDLHASASLSAFTTKSCSSCVSVGKSGRVSARR